MEKHIVLNKKLKIVWFKDQFWIKIDKQNNMSVLSVKMIVIEWLISILILKLFLIMMRNSLINPIFIAFKKKMIILHRLIIVNIIKYSPIMSIDVLDVNKDIME